MATLVAPKSLPILDFSNQDQLNPGSPEWETLKTQVRKALEEYGCFEAEFMKASENGEREEAAIDFSALGELFDLPIEAKTPKESDRPLHDYFWQLPHGPLYESFTVFEPTSLEKIHDFAELMWPQGNPAFSNTLHSLTSKMLKFHETVRKMILESLGVEKYLDELKNSTCHNIGIHKYAETKTSEAIVGLNPHKDSNVMTVLYPNQVGGLEVETKNGDWIQSTPPPNSFVVLVGETLDAWTNGRFHVPVHRVMMAGNVTRYCVGLFPMVKSGYIVKAPEELIDDEHPMAYKPFDYTEFRKYRREQYGSPVLFDLKTYCGV